MPASLTSATVSPAPTRATNSRARARSLCSCRLTSRAAGTPCRSSRICVWRVSSHATTSAVRSASSTRNVTSSRLPIGVAHTSNRPVRRRFNRRVLGAHLATIGSATRVPRKSAAARPQPDQPTAQYTRYRAGRRLRPRRADESLIDPLSAERARAAEPRRGWRERITPKRVILGLLGTDRVLADPLARAVPDQLPLRAHLPAGKRRERARPGGLPADLGQQHPRARLRPPPEGLEGTGRGNDRSGPLGHDHADPHRRRTRGAPVDPARHGARNPRPRPAEDQRRPRVRRTGAVDLGDQELARHPDQPPRGSELRKLSRPDRRDGRRHLHRRLHRLAPRRRLQPRRLHAAAERGHPPPRTASRRWRWRARARTCARPTRPTSSARNTSRRCSPT